MAEVPESLRGYNRQMLQKAMRTLEHEDAVQVRGRDEWAVLSPGSETRRGLVTRYGDQWTCSTDKPNKGFNQDKPCSHIFLAMYYEGLVELPNTADTVWTKGKQGRNHRLENQAWQEVPVKLPQLLRRLLQQGLPIIEPPRRLRGGRKRKALYPLLYQSIIRVAWRQSLRMSRGAMNTLDGQANNPEGSCGVATISRFLASPEATIALEKLLALSTWPARPYESVIHPDGTGLSEQHFSAYFDEKYRKKGKGKKSKDGKPEKPQKPRVHRWSYAEILWTYRYTMVAALHAEGGPFGEAQWLIPLLKRAAVMLQIGELGGDKAYAAYDIFRYAASQGIDPQVKFKDNANPTKSNWRKRAYKQTFEASTLDPLGYAAKANRRNNAETGNHALKAFLGSEVFNRGHLNPKTGKVEFHARRNEILCMAIAYNLARLVYLGLDRGIEPDFAEGAAVLQRAHWRSLHTLAAEGQAEGYRVPDAARPEWAGGAAF